MVHREGKLIREDCAGYVKIMEDGRKNGRKPPGKAVLIVFCTCCIT